MRQQSPWTDANLEMLFACHKANMTASEAAKELKLRTGLYFSRNSVIGKLARCGLRLGRTTEKYQRAQPKTQNRPPRINIKKKVAQHFRKIQLEEPEGNEVFFEELKAHHCRWPKFGAGIDIRYCGAERSWPLPYCDHHCSRAYRPLQKSDRF
jgi:hypothetical protein